jgi:hypothetical protein
MKNFDKFYRGQRRSLNESSELTQYGAKLAVELGKKKIGKWQLMDEYPDTLAIWNGNFPDYEVKATPFYYGTEVIPVSLTDVDQEEVLYNEIPFKPTYDLKKDVKAYLKIMKKELNSIKDYIQ